MILVDANLLLYAYHPRADQHEKSRAWLEAALSGRELVRFTWLTLWAFLRIGTNPRAFQLPLSVSEAEAVVASWLAQPVAGIVEPGERHWDILREAVRAKQRGPLSWTPCSPRLQSNTAPRFSRQTVTFHAFPASNGPTQLAASD